MKEIKIQIILILKILFHFPCLIFINSSYNKYYYTISRKNNFLCFINVYITSKNYLLYKFTIFIIFLHIYNHFELKTKKKKTISKKILLFIIITKIIKNYLI